MSIVTSLEQTNITVKLNLQQKQTLEKAAAMRCLSLSEYLLELALNAATEEVRKSDSIILSEKDWNILNSALENPPEANEALKFALEENHKQYGIC